MNRPGHNTTGRRKRSHVPEASRKRVARACEQCRRVKEKCEGGFPCIRCVRLKRACKDTDQLILLETTTENIAESTGDDFFDKDRITNLERVVQYHARGITMDNESLEQYLATLEDSGCAVAGRNKIASPPDSTASRSGHDISTQKGSRLASTIGPGELSHCRFFDDVQKQIHGSSGNWVSCSREPVSTTVVSSRRARLHLDRSIVIEAAAALPPIDVSRFLGEMFFEFATTNYMYLEESSFRFKLETLYAKASTLTTDDAPSVCMVLMVLALGTQFAHLSSSANRVGAAIWEQNYCDDTASPDDNVTLVLYHAATSLLPDVLAIASVESIQAILLLGVYTLPIDAASLSYSYLGIALRLAIQNDMHRKSITITDPIENERRNRIWWTVYSLERRIAVFHGMPGSLARAEVDAELPKALPDLSEANTTDRIPNFLAVIRLTGLFEDAGATIRSIRQVADEARMSKCASMNDIANELSAYWDTLPVETNCKDLTPSGPLFRSNIHLMLNYHMGRIFIGRTFIFEASELLSPTASTHNDTLIWSTIRKRLVSDCVESATSTVELCQLIHDHIGLARASYTEFTCCRTAVLVILARRVQENSHELQAVSEKGLELLKYMSVGIYSAAAEKAAITAMEVAVGRLNRKATAQSSNGLSQNNSSYDHFRNWALLWSSSGSSDGDGSSAIASSVSHPIQDLDLFNTCLPFDMDEYSSSAGLDVDFPSGFDVQDP